MLVAPAGRRGAGKGANFASVPCEKWQIGAIIGHQGKTVKELEVQSGASIHVDRTKEPPTVEISGSVQAVRSTLFFSSTPRFTADFVF